MLFTGWSSTRITADSISNYISAVRSRCLELNEAMPDRAAMPRLTRLLHGYHNMHKEAKSGRVRLAITASILTDVLTKKLNRETQLLSAGQAVPNVYSLRSYKLSAALYCSLFIGLHRPGELTVRRTSKGVVTKPLRRKHFTFRRAIGGQISGTTVSIPSTKTDQDGLRSVCEYGITGNSVLCATSRLAEMWQARVDAKENISDESYLFAIIGTNGKLRPVCYEDLRSELEKDLTFAGYDAALYQGHSFRIGAASTLHQNGVPNAVIEDAGRWTRGSLSIPLYLRGMTSADLRRDVAQYFCATYTPPQLFNQQSLHALSQLPPIGINFEWPLQ